jgi:hypothetical protein
MKRNPYLIFLLLFGFSNLMSQDCQFVSMSLPIPAGVAKHHFPVQEMPATNAEDAFSFLAEWNTGNLTVRIRFSEDGTDWTNWEILKRNFKEPEALSSPLHLADKQYAYFEWAVYNNDGLESKLSLNFYFPGEDLYYAELEDVYELEVSTVSCPLAPAIENNTPETVVSSDSR